MTVKLLSKRVIKINQSKTYRMINVLLHDLVNVEQQTRKSFDNIQEKNNINYLLAFKE